MHSLLDFPIEVLEIIIDNLVIYPEPHTFQIFGDLDWLTFTQEHVLARLCRTCSALRDIAQPRLYQCLYLLNARYPRAALSLFKYPRLRQYVKRVYFGDIRSSDDALGTSLAQFQDWAKTNTADYDQVMADVTVHVPLQQQTLEDENLTKNLSAIILALVSKTVEFVVFGDDTVPMIELPPEMFPVLKTIALESFQLHRTNDCSLINPIMDAAPNLTLFHSQAASHSSRPMAHSRLKSIEFWYSGIDGSGIYEAVNDMPNLQRLVITVLDITADEDYDAMNLEEFSQALQVKCRGLRYLYLDFSDSYAYEDAELHALRFHELTALTSLTLNGLKFPQSDETELTDMLPESIESLELGWCTENVASHIIHLLSCARESFPKLTQLKVRDRKWSVEDRETIKELCADLGIAYLKSKIRPDPDSERNSDWLPSDSED